MKIYSIPKTNIDRMGLPWAKDSSLCRLEKKKKLASVLYRGQLKFGVENTASPVNKLSCLKGACKIPSSELTYVTKGPQAHSGPQG